jgi:hypothetical protein
MTVALVVVETPAIVLSVIIAHLGMKGRAKKSTVLVVKDALTDGTLLVLIGSMGIGYLLTALGTEKSPLASFIGGDMFTGMLVFFLLYMGTLVGKKFKEIENFPLVLVAFAIIAPIFNGAIAILLSKLFGFAHGDALLLTILCSSSSYIVAPVILKDALPEANPAKYLTMSMGITFPLNIVIGIPVSSRLKSRRSTPWSSSSIAGSRKRDHQKASPPSQNLRLRGSKEGGGESRDRQAGDDPCLATCFCDSSRMGRDGYPDAAGTAGSCGCQNHGSLCACCGNWK